MFRSTRQGLRAIARRHIAKVVGSPTRAARVLANYVFSTLPSSVRFS
jgi:hypothetical protein